MPADSYKHFCRNFFIFFNLELSCFSKFVVSAINFAIYLAQFCHSFFKHFIGTSLFLTPFIFTKMFFSRFFKYIFASSFLLIFFAKVCYRDFLANFWYSLQSWTCVFVALKRLFPFFNRCLHFINLFLGLKELSYLASGTLIHDNSVFLNWLCH